MFEKAIPIPGANPGADAQVGIMPQGGPDQGVIDAGGEAALRVMDWSELTARLNAARDLRHVLRRDAVRSAAGVASEFADAAARFLHAESDNKRDVNPVALEHFKGSPGMVQDIERNHDEGTRNPSHAASGDAREI